jgi:hypothetical protein
MAAVACTRSGALREVAWFLGALAPCPIIAAFADGQREAALERGAAIADAERALGVLPEPAVHAWAEARPGLLAAAWALYLFAHLPAVAGALVWAWLERPLQYAAARNLFLTAQGLTLATYVLAPTAPPGRIEALGMGGGEPSALAERLQSPWAAMPSGHIVFALVAAGIVFTLCRRRAVRALAALYPPLVVGVTMVTANHFWLDAAAAVVVAAAAAGLVLGAAALGRARMPAAATARRMADVPD